MTKLYRSKWHNFFFWLAVIIFYTSALISVIFNMASPLWLGVVLALGILLWRIFYPYIHGHWKVFLALHIYRALIWASQRSSWKKLGVNIVYYVVPMLIRVSPTGLLPLFPMVITLAVLMAMRGNVEGTYWQLGMAGILCIIAMFCVNVGITYATKYFDFFQKKEAEVYLPAHRQRLARKGLL